MLTTLLHLIIEFFKIGVFSVGGGYATIPFLYHLINDYHWYTSDQLTNMIAISMLTPGPVGANMATFAGFKTCGIVGGILATFALVLPSLFFVIIIIFLGIYLVELAHEFLNHLHLPKYQQYLYLYKILKIQLAICR